MPEPLKVDRQALSTLNVIARFYCPCGAHIDMEVIDRGHCACLRSVTLVIGESVSQ